METHDRPTARLFLDLEGIAFDPLPCTINAVRRTMIRLGYPLRTDRDLSWIARQPIQDTLEQLLPADDALRQRFLALLRDYYCRQHWHAARLEPGVPTLLHHLACDYGVERVVVSGNPTETVASQLDDLGLDAVVDRILCPEQGGCANCRRRLVAERTANEDDPPSVWLTDLPGELTSAQEMGIIGVGALWGRITERRLSDAGDHVAESPAALLASWSRVMAEPSTNPAERVATR